MTREEILTEIRQELANLKARTAELESRLSELEEKESAQADHAGPEYGQIDDAAMAISLDDIMEIGYGSADDLPEASGETDVIADADVEADDDVIAETEAETTEETEAETEIEAETDTTEAEMEMEMETEAEVKAEDEAAEEIETETETAAETEDETVAEAESEPTLLDIFGEPAGQDDGTINARHRQHQKKALGDVMTTDEAWRTDIPGSAVRDVRSAISLNDRILFIRSLFDENPEAFQETVSAVNTCETFDEAVSLIKSRHPQWNYNSDTVYRFMMAVRRKATR